EITGRRSHTVSSSLSRIISVIRKEELERSGLTSFADILEYVSNADIRQRSNMGIQADISLRGSSFDHVMILVNGINLSDPQTGHLGLDLPIDPESIERIEVLEGPAARSLGSGAFMGAINIITKKGTEPEIMRSQTMGEFGLLRIYLNAGIKTGQVYNFLSAGQSSASGYVHNTDHELYNIYYRANTIIQSTQFDLQAGYQSKKFGAGGFYSPRFPDQYEENSGWFGSLKVESGNRLRFNQHVYWRRRNDHFLLVRNNPAFYENFHLTDVYGSQMNITYPAGTFIWNGGIDLRSENILSNNIGFEIPDHIEIKGTDSAFYNKEYQRTNLSFFAEQVFTPKNWDITAGLMVNWNTGFHGKPAIFPGIEIGYTTNNGHTAFVNINRALHLPTFTDLFYTDPLNQGNFDLDPNRIISFEGGLKYVKSFINYQMSGFYNSGKDIIDWLWNYESNRFSPVNLENYVVRGFSSTISYDLSKKALFSNWLNHISVNYMFLTIDKSASATVSKYYNLKHKLSAVLSQNLGRSIFITWRISFQDRFGNAIAFNEPEGFYSIPYKPYWLIDGIVKWQIGYFELFSEVSNILNTRYIDAGSVYQPGRWLKAGVSLTFDYNKRGNH
ncbi:MAG TPA: TonB-dependent receptor, partial [Bacteroidales bacterium]|nr:TonB-dependent receptor [Bacteroidales bacterium]